MKSAQTLKNPTIIEDPEKASSYNEKSRRKTMKTQIISSIEMDIPSTADRPPMVKTPNNLSHPIIIVNSAQESCFDDQSSYSDEGSQEKPKKA
jgi:hypothetical protein